MIVLRSQSDLRLVGLREVGLKLRMRVLCNILHRAPYCSPGFVKESEKSSLKHSL